MGESRAVAWGRRREAAALVAELAAPGRGWDAIVVGEYERAFYGSQYAAMAPLFEHYGVQALAASTRAPRTTSHHETRQAPAWLAHDHRRVDRPVQPGRPGRPVPPPAARTSATCIACHLQPPVQSGSQISLIGAPGPRRIETALAEQNGGDARA